MQLIPSTRRPNIFTVLRASLLFAAVAALAACDQHSAEEAPENYGHGSSHERVVPDHKIDSSHDSTSFSDTAGTKDEEAEKPSPTPVSSLRATPTPHFY